MNIQAERNRYFNIDGSKLRCHKQIESQQLQTAVDAFKAKGGIIERIPMGISRYLNDLEKANLQKKYGRSRLGFAKL